MQAASGTKRFTRGTVSGAIAAVRSRLGRDRRVLLYHRVEPAPRIHDPWSVSVDAFVRQLETIHALGYRAVDLTRVAEWPDVGRDREILVAFDDGYRSVLQHAAPALRARGIPFACFLVPGAMGGSSQWERAFGLEPSSILAWQELPELRRAGAVFGSHSLTHRDLSAADRSVLRDEVGRSRAVLRDHGVEAEVFSVPFGRDDPRIDSELVAAGYAVKITNQLARLSKRGNLLVVPCTAVLRDDAPSEFVRKLTGSYDWVNAYNRRRYRPNIEVKGMSR